VRGTWRFDAAARAVRLELEQVQPEGPYQLPVEVSIRRTGAAQPTIERIELRERRQVVSLPADEAPDAVTLDPGTWVLMDVELVRDGGQRE
jgi:hypothetical protein